MLVAAKTRPVTSRSPRGVGATFALLAGGVLGLLTAAAACGGAQACTDAGCENTATVTYPSSLGGEPYLLVLSADGKDVSVRCNDPAAAADNPATITCDGAGFELSGHEFAALRSVSVTVRLDDEDAPTFERAAATLNTVDMNYPNGEDCEPVCFVKTGRVM